MLQEASITGVFRTILIIIGALVVLRFLGQLMQAKRNMEAERELNRKLRQQEEDKLRTQKNFGRTQIIDTKSKLGTVEDVDFEEVE
jgi:hypothetical protein